MVLPAAIFAHLGKMCIQKMMHQSGACWSMSSLRVPAMSAVKFSSISTPLCGCEGILCRLEQRCPCACKEA